MLEETQDQKTSGRDTEEHCDICAQRVGGEHPHVVDLKTRRLLCACRACHFLFGAGGEKYRSVPGECFHAPDLMISNLQWDRLEIPVGIAFFFFNSSARRTVAFYPSPAGAMESLLPLDAWNDIAMASPRLRGLLPDVQALLVRKTGDGFDCYIVPIDACYELVGLIRLGWRGFDGGEKVRADIESFFARLRARSGNPAQSAA